MNRKLFIALTLAVIVVIACNKEKTDITPSQGSAEQMRISTSHSGNLGHHHNSGREGDSANAYSSFITTDVANQMIGSYLSSIGSGSGLNSAGAASSSSAANAYNGVAGNSNGPVNDLKSFSIDADSLRAYLASTNIKSVKLIFAHTMDYISAGNQGLFAGMQSGAMTIIIAGYDVDGNYVYYTPGGANGQGGQYVLDHCSPCPANCPPGTAGGDLLQ